MFFKKNYKYGLIEEVPTETLKQFCEQQGIMLELGVMDCNDWAIFSQYYGLNHGLNHIESVSFAYMVSLFISGMGVSASTEVYLQEEIIEFDILEALNNIKVQITDEEEQVKTLFEYIFILYHDKLDKYWKKTERLDFRLSVKQLEDFNSVPGKTKSEKLQTLLRSYYD